MTTTLAPDLIISAMPDGRPGALRDPQLLGGRRGRFAVARVDGDGCGASLLDVCATLAAARASAARAARRDGTTDVVVLERVSEHATTFGIPGRPRC